MVTKAIIEGIISDYEVTVSIPLLETTSSEALICTLPQGRFIPKIGDVVFVAFEDYDIGRPVVIGCLFKESGNISEESLNLADLNVSSTTKLSKQTTIGEVKYTELQCLKGLTDNLQYTIDNLTSRIERLEQQ